MSESAQAKKMPTPTMSIELGRYEGPEEFRFEVTRAENGYFLRSRRGSSQRLQIASTGRGLLRLIAGELAAAKITER